MDAVLKRMTSALGALAVRTAAVDNTVDATVDTTVDTAFDKLMLLLILLLILPLILCRWRPRSLLTGDALLWVELNHLVFIAPCLISAWWW